MSIVTKDGGEPTEPKAPELNEDGSPKEVKEPASDPLDAIEDEDVRNDMKRLRAIDQRAKKKAAEELSVEEKKPEETPSDSYATKDDLKLLATNNAKKLVAPEVKDLWDELTAIPLGGYDPMDSESIADNMAKRLKLYRIDNPEEGDDPTKDMKTSTDTSTSKGKTLKKTEKAEVKLPGYSEPTKPEDWYPEKE